MRKITERAKAMMFKCVDAIVSRLTQPATGPWEPMYTVPRGGEDIIVKFDDGTLAEILDLHKRFLDGEEDGRRADLRDMDLHGADLHGADLRRADLSGASLHKADLCGTVLRGADLRKADLSGADLSGADLCEAVLRWTDLYGADLSYADLCKADLRRADLRRADLRYADLGNADLRGVILYRAELSSANLRGANLDGANIDYASWPLWCGSFKVRVDAQIFRQLVDHIIALDCDDEEARKVQEWLRKNATPSHVAKYLRGGE